MTVGVGVAALLVGVNLEVEEPPDTGLRGGGLLEVLVVVLRAGLL